LLYPVIETLLMATGDRITGSAGCETRMAMSSSLLVLMELPTERGVQTSIHSVN
jgi:hypothetical protein